MAIPPAYLLSWTCYGQRLHGDQRGSVDRSHNVYGTPYLAPHAARESAELEALRGDPVVLTAAMRRIARDALVEHVPFRQGELHALNVRSTHVHLVVAAPTAEPGRFAGSCKAWTTRKLREAGLAGLKAPVWTSRGSSRYLWDAVSIKGAVDYALFEQGEMDEFMVAGEGWEELIAARAQSIVLGGRYRNRNAS